MTFRRGSLLKLAYSACIAVIASGTVLMTACEKGEKPAAEKQAAESAASRVPFAELFAVDGSTVTPKKVIRAGSITMTPDVPFDIQVMKLFDTPFAEFIGRDAEIRQSGVVCEIVQFY